jgi:arylsulfatase A-like enzyme
MLSPTALAEMRRAFYALCTHIDHQLRLVLGTLREEGLLGNTVIMFAADHGDMLGDFGLYAKRMFYEGSSRVPMILAGAAGDKRVPVGKVDDRLVGLADVMPTLLDLADCPIPSTVEGKPMHGAARHAALYGDCLDNNVATRMIHDGRYKLIWYPAGNHVQLFDLEQDPRELNNLAGDAGHAGVRARLTETLCGRLWGIDVEAGWARDGKLIGHDPGPYVPRPDRSWGGQRGTHFPQPPQIGQDEVVGFPPQ